MMDSMLSEDESLEKIPNLEIPNYIHHLLHIADEESVREKILELVEKDSMAPLYKKLCEKFSWCSLSNPLLAKMESNNNLELLKIDEAIEDAKANLGVVEIKQCYLKKAEFFSRIGDKESALKTFKEAIGKAVPMGGRLDSIFHLMRIGFFFMDFEVMKTNLKQLKDLMDRVGDWQRRNRLKIYEGLYHIHIRDFRTACNSFVDTISTFTSYEIMSYSSFIRYTVYLSMMVLPRGLLFKKIIENERIKAALAYDSETNAYLFSFHNCHYAEFFVNLAKIEQILKKDYIFYPHYRYYVREMKLVAYSQLMESYRTLTLPYLAEKFGVCEDYIEQDLSQLILSGRLNCQIDRVANTVESKRPDKKNQKFQLVVKQGDVLLNRIQKLSRVIEI